MLLEHKETTRKHISERRCITTQLGGGGVGLRELLILLIAEGPTGGLRDLLNWCFSFKSSLTTLTP